MTRARGRVAWWLGASLALVALALLLAVSRRGELAELAILWRLATRGVAPATLRVERLGVDGIELRELAFGPPSAPDLTLAALDLTWSARGLRDGLYDSAHASGLRLSGSLREDGLHLGAADPLWRGAGASGPAALPAREIDLHDAEVRLETPEGPARGTLEGELREVGGVLAGELELVLRDGRVPPRVARTTLRGEVSGPPSHLRFDLVLTGAKGRLRAEARGHADLEARAGEAELRLSPVVFAPGALQPTALVPALAPLVAGFGIEDVTGRIEALGTLRVAAGEPVLRVTVALRGLGFESALARVSGVAGALTLEGPPLRTPKGQLLSIAVLDPGVPLTDGLLDFQLLPGGVLALHRATWTWAGGELRAAELTLDPEAARNEARLDAHQLDLAALLALVAPEGLEGTGRLDGELPLVRSGGRIRVEDGVLRASPGGGTLRYQPSESARSLAASRPDDFGVALAAFSDFRYDALEARLDGDLDGVLQIALHVRGANPAYDGGRPIELNLSLEAPLAGLVRAGMETYRVPDAVEKRLRDFSAKEAR